MIRRKLMRGISPSTGYVLASLRGVASSAKVIVDKDRSNGIASIYLNNPPVNILNAEMLQECTEAIKSLQNDKEVQGVLLTSNFKGKVFCAGLNIFDLYNKSHKHVSNFWRHVQDWHLAFFGYNRPITACVNGHAPAGGCLFSLLCDYRVMQADGEKRIGLNESKLGIAPPFSVADLLIRTIGQRSAEDAILRGKLFSAQEALNAGLVDAIADLDGVQDKAEKALLGLIHVSGYSPTKLILRQNHIDHLNKVKLEEADAFADHILTPEVQRDICTYLSKMGSKT